MRIEHLSRAVEAYLSGRSVILRELKNRAFSLSELEAILSVPYAVLSRRRRKPELWRPTELHQLAKAMSISPDTIMGLRPLAVHLQALPDAVRGPLLKDSRLNLRKFTLRVLNHDSWQYDEVAELATTLRRWQDSRKMDRLLAAEVTRTDTKKQLTRKVGTARKKLNWPTPPRYLPA